jgi:hypothetical protein
MKGVLTVCPLLLWMKTQIIMKQPAIGKDKSRVWSLNLLIRGLARRLQALDSMLVHVRFLSIK